MKIITCDVFAKEKQKAKEKRNKNIKENLKAFCLLFLIISLYAIVGTIEYNSPYK